MSLFDATFGTFLPTSWWLIDLALRSTLLAGAIFVLLHLLRRRSAALRALVASVGMSTLLILPLSMSVTPGGFGLLPSIATWFGGGEHVAWPPPAPTPSTWLLVVLTIWLGGALLLALRSLVAARRLEDFYLRAQPLDSRLEKAAVRCLGTAGSRRIAFGLSDEIDVPITFGLLRARVLLPADAESWPESRLDLVLLHEGAHIERRDLLGHAIGIATCSLLWWQPLAWHLARRAELEREHAADDRVLRGRPDPRTYAQELMEIADRLEPHEPAFGIPMARRSQLRVRLGALLDERIDRRRPPVIIALGFAGLTLLMMVAVAGVAPGSGTTTSERDAAESPRIESGHRAYSTPPQLTPPGHASGRHPIAGSHHASGSGHSSHASHSAGTSAASHSAGTSAGHGPWDR